MPRLALVTGGTRGIGAGIAIALSSAGYKVVVNYHRDDKIDKEFEKENNIPVENFNKVRKNNV